MEGSSTDEIEDLIDDLFKNAFDADDVSGAQANALSELKKIAIDQRQVRALEDQAQKMTDALSEIDALKKAKTPDNIADDFDNILDTAEEFSSPEMKKLREERDSLLLDLDAKQKESFLNELSTGDKNVEQYLTKRQRFFAFFKGRFSKRGKGKECPRCIREVANSEEKRQEALDMVTRKEISLRFAA